MKTETALRCKKFTPRYSCDNIESGCKACCFFDYIHNLCNLEEEDFEEQIKGGTYGTN